MGKMLGETLRVRFICSDKDSRTLGGVSAYDWRQGGRSLRIDYSLCVPSRSMKLKELLSTATS